MRFFKKLLIAISLLLVLFSSSAYGKPSIVVIATGGTIAGSGTSSVSVGYTAAQIAVDAILDSAPQIKDVADVRGLQLCNIPSQAMNSNVWLKLARTIDSLFVGNYCDGVVVTHGTDTMEETAYFLNLTIKHSKPVVLTGSMRPSTAISADGPANLFNAVSLAADSRAVGQGVMVVINDHIYSADDITKVNSVNVEAFDSPNYGAMGSIMNGVAIFHRKQLAVHTIDTEFPISSIEGELPKIDIVYCYADADATAFNAFVDNGSKGVVIAGVGHGNFSPQMGEAAAKAVAKGVPVVRSSRIVGGGTTYGLEDPFEGQIASFYKSPQKAKILLALALTKTTDLTQIQDYFERY